MRIGFIVLLGCCTLCVSAQMLRQPRSVAAGADGTLFVATVDDTTLKVLSPEGKILAQSAPRGTGEHEVQFPQRVLLVQGEVWILDAPARRVQIFEARPPCRYRRTLPLPVEDPQDVVDIAADPTGRVFLLTRPDNRVHVLTPEGRPITAFAGAGQQPEQLVNPTSITVDRRGRVLVTDTDRRTNRHRIKIYRYSALRAAAQLVKDVPAWLDPIQVCVNARGHLVTLGALGYYEDGGAIRIITERGDRVAHTGLFSLGGMGRAGGIALLPDDRVVLADEVNNRLVILPPDLGEPDPVVALQPGEATIRWRSPSPATEAVVWYGTEENNPASWRRQVVRWQGTRREMLVRLRGLPLSKRVFYRFSPALPTIGKEGSDLSKVYSFLSAPPRGKMHVLTLDVLTVVYLKADVDGTVHALTHEQIGDKLQREFEKCREWYFRNTHFRLHLNLKDYLFLEEPTARVRRGWIAPESVREQVHPLLEAQGKRVEDYDSIIAVWASPGYDASKPDQLGDVGGGGLTTFGYSTFAISGKLAWLLCHEYSHQLDAFFDRSGVQKFWLNHPDPTIHPGRYGQHWDVNAFICRKWNPNDWLTMRFGKIWEVDDVNGNGIPDDDPRLPLDERRLGRIARPGNARSDDLRKAMTGLFFGYRLDTGMPDGIGYREEGATWRLPREAVLPIPYADLRGEIDHWFHYARAQNRFLAADIFAAWNERELQFGIVCRDACDAEIDIDADNNGWFSGNDNLNVRLRVRGVEKPEITARVWDGALGTWVEAPTPSLETRVLPDGRSLYRIGIPRGAVRWQVNALAGVRIVLIGDRGWCSAFEPWVLMQTRFVRQTR
jgi:streptogramin lyase